MTEDWLFFSIAAMWSTVQLARILASYRTGRRRDQIKAGRSV